MTDYKRHIKTAKISEGIWFSIAIAVTIMSIYYLATESFEDARHYLFLPPIAWAWWFVRRMFRKRWEKQSNGK